MIGELGAFLGGLRSWVRRALVPALVAAPVIAGILTVPHHREPGGGSGGSNRPADRVRVGGEAPGTSPVSSVDRKPRPIVTTPPPLRPSGPQLLPAVAVPIAAPGGPGEVGTRPKTPDDHTVCADTLVAGVNCFDLPFEVPAPPLP